ncbi:MAG TPA: hypothetical protein VLH79_15905 [Chthonomonadales bacterium]|nr:hypothetical protein [Chthonomonadales bacterium]
MMPATHGPRRPPTLTALTPRQRRLRIITIAVLAVVTVLVAVGLLHPFFDLQAPAEVTPEVRRALAVRGIVILFYWTVCMLLGLSLAVLAWLDIREIQRRLRDHRLALLKSLTERTPEGGDR